MNRRNSQIYEVLTRVVDFGTRNVGLFPSNSSVAELLDTLESGMKTLSEEDAIRASAETAAKIRRAAQLAAVEKLKGYMLKASQLSQALHSNKVRLPAVSTKRTLLESANGFLRDADSMKKDFVDHGLSKDFAEIVRSAVEALERANLEYSKAKAAKSEAVEKFARAREEVMDALHRFDVLAGNALEDIPGALASYTTARSITRTRGRNKTSAETPPQPATAFPTASAAVA